THSHRITDPHCISSRRRPPPYTIFPYTTLFRSTTSTGSAASQATPISATHAYTALGLYSVRVTVTNSGGGSGADTVAVHVVAHRSEEHTSELQSRVDLVCRLLLEKKKQSRNPRV